MSFKKKLAVTTIAASVVMSAFAGIPLSNKGLAEKLGVSNVIHAAAYSDFAARAQQVYAKLDADGLAKVNAFRAEIANAVDADSTILSPLVEKLIAGTNVDSATINDLIEDILTLTIDKDWQENYEAIAAANDGFLNDLYPELSVNDVASVLHNFELKVANLISTLTVAQLSDLTAIKEQLKTAANQAILSNTTFANFAQNRLTSQDLADVFTKLQASEGVVHFSTALAAYSVLNKAYFEAFPVPVTPNPTYPVVIFPTTGVPAEAQIAVNNLEALKGKLENATEAEKAELIAQAVKDAGAAVSKLSTLTGQAAVQNNQATLAPNENNAISAIKGIAAIANALKSVTGETLPAATLTLDFGAVTQDELLIKVSAAIVSEGIQANLAGIAIKAGEFVVTLPVGGNIAGAIDLNVKQSAPSEELTQQATFASDVFEFNLAVDNKPVTTFSKPIQIVFPLSDTTGLDTELLTLAKIVEDKLQFFGGRYKNGALTEARDTFSSYAVVENKVSFGDTSVVEDWAGRAIQVIAAKGAINGKAEGVFAPQDQVTRAEFAKMLIHALDLDNVSATATFGDVVANDWFAPYVAAAADLGVINGRSANRFDPQAKITRAEMATMVARALKAKGATAVEDLDAELAVFSDAGQISSSLKEGVAFAAHHGIVIGNDGKFSPNSNATRAQAAVIIYRAFNF
ncbi:S-layer homology domain-containing protein [Paenibacillus sp. CAU 1782]